ncbi:MAG TPA: four helix bundle protein [Flavitalea sp.]|nr:four helix bundle protein [Flavitalea sp.]
MSASVFDFDLFKEIHQLTIDLLKTADCLPKPEQHILTSQLRRAAISVPSNFAEGYRKSSVKDKLRMYNIALCSLEECRYYLVLANDLYNLIQPEMMFKLDKTARRFYGYCRAIRENHKL